MIPAGATVFIVDDFLAQGTTLEALGDLVLMAGGRITAFGVVLEKTFEQGREALGRFGAPLYSLVKVQSLSDGVIQLARPSLS